MPNLIKFQWKIKKVVYYVFEGQVTATKCGRLRKLQQCYEKAYKPIFWQKNIFLELKEIIWFFSKWLSSEIFDLKLHVQNCRNVYTPPSISKNYLAKDVIKFILRPILIIKIIYLNISQKKNLHN